MTDLTLQMMTSPRPAVRRLLPPRTLMHITSLAPVLSATAMRVSCWIMLPPGNVFVLLFARDFHVGDFKAGLLGLGHHAFQHPPLKLRQRRRLLNLHRIAVLRNVFL